MICQTEHHIRKITSLLFNYLHAISSYTNMWYAGNEHTDINRLSTFKRRTGFRSYRNNKFAEIIETEKVQINREERTKFTVQCEDIINEIIVIEKNTQIKIKLLKIKQDDILDVIEIRNDGKILLTEILLTRNMITALLLYLKIKMKLCLWQASIYWGIMWTTVKNQITITIYSTLNI